jgi:ABC-type antimicrobial peptide transport system permease subunit
MWLDAYVPYQQWSFGRMDIVLRTSVEPLSVVPAFRRAVYAGDQDLPLSGVTTMEAAVAASTAGPRFTAILLGLFAGIAVLLAAVGLYGVLATTVRQRTSEIGMRMVCGAKPVGILRLVLFEGLRLSAVGMAAGLVIALSMAGLIRSMLVSVTPTDPLTFVAITLLFVAVVIVSTMIPALRASRVDPVVAIRNT